MLLVEVTSDQRATDATSHRSERASAQRIAEQRTTGTARDRADRSVTPAALPMIMPASAMVDMVVTIIVLREYR